MFIESLRARRRRLTETVGMSKGGVAAICTSQDLAG